MALASPKKRKKVLDSLTKQELLELSYDWDFWARPKQLPPEEYFYIWLILAGRGFGKTRTGAEFILRRVAQGYKRIALIGQTVPDVRETMVELEESSIMNVAPPWLMPKYIPSKRRLIFPNGAVATTFSGDKPGQLRGPQHDTAWIDEIAKFRYPEDTLDNLMFGLRLSDDPKICITTTPRPTEIIKGLVKKSKIKGLEEKIIVTTGSTYENKANLSKKALGVLVEKYEGTRIGRQELRAEILDDTPGALWTYKLIEKYRVTEYPDLVRVVVAIDPAAKSNADNAETGMMVGGIGTDGHGYLLADISLRARPAVWGAAAVNAYHDYCADRIVAEVNNGGEMVEHTIRTCDDSVSYKDVHASRGKLTRAEPISALYEQGKIHHIGCFPALEDQQCNWVPGELSPDRMDALVWLFFDLMINHKKPWIG